MLRNTKMLMRRSERESNPRMPWRAIALALSTLLKMRNSRTNLMPLRRLPFLKRSKKLKAG
jgi:hypothetical protein